MEEQPVERGADPPGPRRRLPRGRELRRLLLTGAIVLVIALFWLDEMRWGIDPEAVARTESLPAEVLVAEDPALAEVERLYARGEYAAASLALAPLRAERPADADLALLEGSALRMLGDTERALAVLEGGLELLEDGAPAAFGDELRWQLAQARLEEGDWQGATALLEELAGRPSPRASDAREQLAEL